MVKAPLLGLVIGGTLLFASVASAQTPLNIQAQAAQGFAAPGNNQPANILVVVTNPVTGAPVPNLIQAEFSIANHFGIPGQVCGFGGGISLFHSVGNGVYQIQVQVHHVNPNVVCTWVKGDYLGQLTVSSPQGQGFVPFKFGVN